MELKELTALELGRRIRVKEISCKEALDAAYSVCKEEEKLNAFSLLSRDYAYSCADKVQKKILEGEIASPLAGVPMGIKANISTKNIITSCGSKMLENYSPVFDATSVARLKENGCVIMGKCNMDEFAMGSSTETSFHGICRNPWNETCVPGGSSGGCAAAVGSGQTYYALGSDTGGSIRQPASFCNVTGVKPTYGAVSRYGLIAYGSSLDQIGPMARDIMDCTEILSIISGYDRKDPTSRKMEMGFSRISEKAETEMLKGMKIGLPKEYFSAGLDPEVKEIILRGAKKCEELGAYVEEFEFMTPEMMDCTIGAYYIIACAEASSNLGRFDGIRYGFSAKEEDLARQYTESRSKGFGLEVKRRLMLGSFVLSAGFYDAYYNKAQLIRSRLTKLWNSALDNYSFILSPVAPHSAYPIGENTDDPVAMMLGDVYTVAVNMAGLPAVSLPAGFTRDNMPVGMQLIGKAFDEPRLFRAAHSFQMATDFHRKMPDKSLGGGNKQCMKQ